MGTKNKSENTIVYIAFVLMVVFATFLFSRLTFEKNPLSIGVLNEKQEKILLSTKESALFFSDEVSGLSFNYPKEFSFYERKNEIGYSIVMEDDEAKTGFQVNVLPWDEGEKRLTKARIREDLPDIVMEKFAEVDLEYSEGVLETITFVSEDADQKIRDVWFIKGEYLYQFRLPIDDEYLIDIIFNTIRFQ